MTTPPKTILLYASTICVRADGLRVAVASYFDAAWQVVVGAFLWRQPDHSDLNIIPLSGQGRIDECVCALVEDRLAVVTKGDDALPTVREYVVDETLKAWAVADQYSFGVPETRGCQVCTLDDGRLAIVGYRQGQGVNFEVAVRRPAVPPGPTEVVEPIWRSQWFPASGPGGQPAVDLAVVPWMDGRLACYCSRDGSHAIGIGLIGVGDTLTLDTFLPELINDQSDPKNPSQKIMGDMAPDDEATGIVAARYGHRTFLCYGRSRDIHQLNTGGENLVQPVVTSVGVDLVPTLLAVLPDTEWINADHNNHQALFPTTGGMWLYYKDAIVPAPDPASYNTYAWKVARIGWDSTVSIVPDYAEPTGNANDYIGASLLGDVWIRDADGQAALTGILLPVLQFERLNDGVRLSWNTPGFVLQRQDAIGAPWSDISGAVSPYETNTPGFFRLRKT